MNTRIFDTGRLAGAAALAVGAAFLASCGDGDGKQERKVEAAAQPTETAQDEGPCREACCQEFVDRSIFEVADMLRAYVKAPEITESVRLLHELAEKYLDALYAEKSPTPEDLLYRCRVESKLGDLRADLQANERAGESYARVIETMDSLPEKLQNSVPARRVKSATLAGQAWLAIVKGDLDAAQQNAEAALAIDRSLVEQLTPQQGETPDPAYESVARDLMGSYKVRADILLMRDDPEEARDTYKRAVELAKQLKQGSPETARKLVVVLSALGDLEKQTGNLDKAIESWFSAAKFCQELAKQNRRDVKAQAVRDFKALKERIEGAQVEKKAQGKEVQPTEPLEAPDEQK